MRLSALLFLGMICLAERPMAARADSIVLRLTMQQSMSDPIGETVIRFKNEVERETNGTLIIDVHDKGQLYPDYQVPEVIGGGAVELGVTQLANFSQYVPVAGVFMQPFLFNFDAILRAAARPDGDIRKMIDSAIVNETGARVLWWQPYGWNVIFSKGPIATPKAIAGRNIRVFDEVAAEFVRLCGGTPQVISESKQVEALDLNIVDATMTSAAGVKDYDLPRRTDTISDIRHSANVMVILVNDDIWKTLSSDQQAIVTKAAMTAEIVGWAGFQAREAEIYAYAKTKGMAVQRPAGSELIEWRTCSSDILESFMSRAGDAGDYLLSAYGKLRADPCCGVDPTADPAK
jgi:C4-dicarboxylate-binding protein DctP